MSEQVNTAFPYQPNYTPPEPDGYQPPRVIAHAINVEGTPVAQAHATAVHAKEAFIKHMESVQEQKSHFSNQGFHAQVKAFGETAAARAVTEKLGQVEQRRAQAQARVEKVRRDLSPDGDTAAEMRASRYWDRTRRLLDAADGGTVLQAARSFISKAEPAELGTLLQELGPYLESRGSSPEGWMDAAIAQAVPELASAKAELMKAEQALQVTKYNTDALARAFSQGSTPAALVDPANYDPDAQ